MQAGSSPRGRAFAARWAELIFCPQHKKEDMQEFYADIHTRMEALGRNPRDCAIMPQIEIVLGETQSIAEEKAEFLDSLVDPDLVLAMRSSEMGVDLSKSAAELADAAANRRNQGMHSSVERFNSLLKTEGASVADAIKKTRRSMVVGTASTVADQMQDLFESHACDGFVVSQLIHPTTFEQISRSLVPELQKRGIFRKQYRGKTLRDNLRATPHG
jgi:alkanesulfonate monooxygenase SsuD/methylene tetrahydromethanopterin reductase-like flavin-dependent oxidoreductase (luciferase family)